MPRSHQTGRQEAHGAEKAGRGSGRAAPRTTGPNGGRQMPPTDTAFASPATAERSRQTTQQG